MNIGYFFFIKGLKKIVECKRKCFRKKWNSIRKFYLEILFFENLINLDLIVFGNININI